MKNPFIYMLFLTSSLVSAQPDTLIYEYREVVVAATRSSAVLDSLPLSVSYLTINKDFRAMSNPSLQQLSAYLPGLQVDDRSNLSQGDRLSVRGIGSRSAFGTRGIKVLLDGIPLTFPDGTTQLNNVSIPTLESVTLIRGPSAIWYGNAAGGVLLLNSTSATEATHTQIDLSGGSFGFNRLAAQWSGKVDHHKMLFSAFRTGLTGYRNHSDAEEYGFNIIDRIHLQNGIETAIVLNGYHAPYLLNPSGLSKTEAQNNPTQARSFVRNQGSGKSITQFQGGMTLSKSDFESEWSVTGYGQYRDLRNNIPGTIIRVDRRAGGVRGHITYPKLSNLTLGGDLDWQLDGRTEYENLGLSKEFSQYQAEDIRAAARKGTKQIDQDEFVIGTGLFAHAQWPLGPRWTLSGGVRFDHFAFETTDRIKDTGIDRSGQVVMTRWSPSAGLLYQPDRYSTAYVHVATAFQTPTLNELSNTPEGKGGLNSALNPESIIGIEAGRRLFMDELSLWFETALYYQDISDLILPFPLPNDPGDAVYYANAGDATISGLEIMVLWPLKTWLTYRVSGQVQTSSIKKPAESEAVAVPGIPDYKFYHQLALSFRQNQLFITGTHTGPTTASDTVVGSAANRPAFSLVDLGVSLPFDMGVTVIRLNGQIKNILDVQYSGSVIPNATGDRFFEPAPGRHFIFALSATF